MSNAVLGRIILISIGIILSGYYAFKRTPELDGVDNAFMYRVSYGIVMLKGFCFIVFDLLHLFSGE